MITKECAITSAMVIKDYCKQHRKCKGCELYAGDICAFANGSLPEDWEITKWGECDVKCE